MAGWGNASAVDAGAGFDNGVVVSVEDVPAVGCLPVAASAVLVSAEGAVVSAVPSTGSKGGAGGVEPSKEGGLSAGRGGIAASF